MQISKYLEMLDSEIGKLIDMESRGLSDKGESALHILLENRKHAKKLMDEKGSVMDSSNPHKSYFGGDM